MNFYLKLLDVDLIFAFICISLFRKHPYNYYHYSVCVFVCVTGYRLGPVGHTVIIRTTHKINLDLNSINFDGKRLP
jgi:hypothetical protein